MGKDLLFLGAVCCVVVITAWRGWRFPISMSVPTVFAYGGLVLLIALLAVAALFMDGLLMAMVGVRAHLALLAFLPGVYMQKEDIQKIWDVLKYLLIVQMVFAIWSANYYGSQLSRQYFRVTGTFHNPNTLGLFCVTTQLFLLSANVPVFRRWLYWGVAMLLIIFTGSRTAIALALLVIIVYGVTCLQRKKDQCLLFGAALLCLPLLPMMLEWISGRDGVLYHLFDSGHRLGATWHYLMGAEPIQALLGKGLGSGTNTLWHLHRVTGIAAVGGFDNLLGNELLQGGVLLLSVMLAFVFSPWLRLRHRFLSIALPGVFLGASFGAPLWEVWPANILLLTLYGYLCNTHS